jgi:hypothetical protein
MEDKQMEIPNTGLFPCPKCSHEPFPTIQGLRMHDMRVHTKAGQEGAMWKLRGTSLKYAGETEAERETRLARKRLYQQRLRARYKREGKDSKGKLRPEGYQPRKSPGTGNKQEYMRKWYLRKRAEKKNSANLPVETTVAPEIWIMQSSGVIRCPHCQKVVGEIKQQSNQEGTKWHVA